MHNKPFYGEAINKKLKLSFLTIKCDIFKNILLFDLF